MTQFNRTLAALLSGKKTETSRLALPEPDGTGEFDCEMIGYPLGVMAVQRYQPKKGYWRTIWKIDETYSIQPGRGQRSVGRFVVEDIWRQDVRTLTPEQVKAEGFDSLSAFLVVWCGMHDKTQNPVVLGVNDKPLDDAWHKAFMAQHPHPERYQAWRMTIRVLWPTVDWGAPAVRALQIDKSSLY